MSASVAGEDPLFRCLNDTEGYLTAGNVYRAKDFCYRQKSQESLAVLEGNPWMRPQRFAFRAAITIQNSFTSRSCRCGRQSFVQLLDSSRRLLGEPAYPCTNEIFKGRLGQNCCDPLDRFTSEDIRNVWSVP
jgi:hypothetical protein